ncbi:MAG: tetratricopeptide repeat protein [bacterium]|nr:tetratricopeptide repeat protein [bacterium]
MILIFLAVLVISLAARKRRKKEAKPVTMDASAGEPVILTIEDNATPEIKETSPAAILPEEPILQEVEPESLPENMMLQEFEIATETAVPAAVSVPPASVPDFVNILKSDMEAELITLITQHFPSRINFKEMHTIDDEIRTKCSDLIDKLSPLEKNNYPFKKEYYRAKSIFYFGTRDIAGLNNNIENAMRLFPQEDEFLVQHASCLMYNHQIEEAERHLLRAKELNPANLDVYFLLGEINFSKNSFYDSLNMFKKVILFDSRNSLAYAYKGYILAMKGYISDGEADLKRSISLDYKNYLPYFFLGNIYKELNFSAKAIDMYKKAFKFGCPLIELPENYASCQYQLKKYDVVISQLSPLAESGLITNRGAELLADAYEQVGENQKAILLIRKILETAPEKKTWLRLGELYFQAKDMEKALEAFKNAVDGTNETELYLKIGRIYLFNLKNYSEAEKYFLMVIQKDKSNFEALSSMVNTSYYGKNHEEAIKYFEELVRLPSYRIVPEVLFKAGISYYKSKKFEEAIRYLSKAEALGYVDEELFNALAYSSFKQGKVNKAIDEYKKCIVINAFNPATYNNLGVIYAQQEDYQNAIRQFKHALNVDKENKDALFNLYKAFKILSKSESDKYLTQLKEII